MKSKQLGILLLVLASLGALIGTHLQAKSSPKSYVVFPGFDELTLTILEAQGEEFRWEGPNLIVTSDEPRHLMSTLGMAMEAQFDRLAVYRKNVWNQKTTRTTEGGPYRRMLPAFDQAGKFQGSVVDEREVLWLYQPTHPDAVKAGSRKGYVAYPQICSTEEQRLIAEASAELSSLSLLMKKLDPEVVLGNEAGPLSFMHFDLYQHLEQGQKAAEPAHRCEASCLATRRLDDLEPSYVIRP